MSWPNSALPEPLKCRGRRECPIIVLLDKTTRFDWLISGPSKAVLDRKKAYWTGKSKTFFNKQKQKGLQKFSRKVYFSYWKFYFKWDMETGKKFPSDSCIQDTDMFSTEFREDFGLWSLIMAIQ